MQHCLSRAALNAGLCITIEPILDGDKVKGREIREERGKCRIDLREGECLVRLLHVQQQGVQHEELILIHWLQLRIRHSVSRKVKVASVAQQELAAVSHTPHRLSNLP